MNKLLPGFDAFRMEAVLDNAWESAGCTRWPHDDLFIRIMEMEMLREAGKCGTNQFGE